jgi:hypothetical protein
MLLILYLALCLAVGFFGRERSLGFLGYFLFSIFLSPLVMLLIQVATHQRFLRQYEQQRAARSGATYRS